MKVSIIACVVSFATALLVGVACLALFLLGVRSDISHFTRVYEPPFIYAGLPIVAFLGLSMAFAHWKLSAARVFATVSVVVFFGPIVLLTATPRIPRWGELIGFLVMAVLSLSANWCAASLVRRQLEKVHNRALNTDAERPRRAGERETLGSTISRSLRTWVYSLGPILLLGLMIGGPIYFSHRSAVEKREAEARELRLYEEANLSVSRGNVQRAYRIYSHLCQDGSHVHKRVPYDEQPCIKATVYGREIRAAHKVTVEAVEKYRAVHGKYPNDLGQVADQLPPEASRAFAGFKLHPGSTGAPQVLTGVETIHRFSLGR